MKSKINKILVIILIIWFLVFITDMICFYSISKPIFMAALYGGEVTTYIGLGYQFNRYYPLTHIDDPVQSSYTINAVPYIVVNIIVVAFLLFRVFRKHNNK